MTMTDLLTTGQIADIRGVHRTTVYHWISSGKLPVAQVVNGIRLISREDLDNFIAERNPERAS